MYQYWKAMRYWLILLALSPSLGISAMNMNKGAIGRDYINTSTLTGIAKIEWEDGSVSTSPKVDFNTGILNLHPSLADGIDNEGEGGPGGGLSTDDFNLHATTSDAKWETQKSSADVKNYAQDLTFSTFSVQVDSVSASLGGIPVSTRAFANFDSARSSTFSVQIDSISAAIGGVHPSTRTNASNWSVWLATTQAVIKSTTSELADNTNTINALTNMVSWNSLKDVPAGFADGTDATGGGGSAPNMVIATSAWQARIPTVEVAIGTVTITPSATTSRILIHAANTFVKDAGATARNVQYRVTRGINRTDPRVGEIWDAHSMALALSTFTPTSLFVIDSPNTTSPVTYTVQARVLVGISSYTRSAMMAEEIPQ